MRAMKGHVIYKKKKKIEGRKMIRVPSLSGWQMFLLRTEWWKKPAQQGSGQVLQQGDRLMSLGWWWNRKQAGVGLTQRARSWRQSSRRQSRNCVSPKPLSGEINHFKYDKALGIGRCPDVIDIFKRLLWRTCGEWIRDGHKRSRVQRGSLE